MSSSLVVSRRLWPLKAPFRISRGVKTAAETVQVEIRRAGATGRGEAVPYARYGETVEGVIGEIEAVSAAVADGAPRAELLTLLSAGAARNAVDCALWDLEARLSGVSVADRIGRPLPATMVTAVTVSLDAPQAMAAAARAVAARRC
ncbi:hypothetical protein [Caulobacter sp. 17J80-11]|uniref:hypothetical protein n=1 Tax=Caulobacter sp. 17J80-11 TaxID=2763502 RepID=UPI00351C40DA